MSDLEPKKVPVLAESGYISTERMAELEAKAEQEIEDQLRLEAEEAATKSLKKSILIKQRGKLVKGEKVVAVTMDLPDFANYVALDGQVFWHGHHYPEVRASQAAVLNEQMQRAWNQHHDEKGTRDQNAYRRKLNPHISASGAAA